MVVRSTLMFIESKTIVSAPYDGLALTPVYPTLNILDPWWPQASVTSPAKRLLRGLPFGSWKRSGEAHQSLLLPKSGFFTPVWKCFYMDVINAFATSCYRIMQNIKPLHRVSNARIHEMTNNQPLINIVRQRQLRFLGHKWRTMQEICSLCSNSWQKKTRETKDKLHIVHPEAARDTEKICIQMQLPC